MIRREVVSSLQCRKRPAPDWSDAFLSERELLRFSTSRWPCCIFPSFRNSRTVLAIASMSQFRAKKLDIGCFAKIRNIRDHTKRKVFAEHEPER